MRIPIKTLSILVITIYLFPFCKKNHADQPIIVPKINRLSFIHPNYVNPPGASEVKFSYDLSNRVTRIFIHLDSSVIVSPTDSICSIDFYYTGLAQLPSSVFVNYQVQPSRLLHLFTYDANNRLVKDSVVNQTGVNYSCTYTYPPNKIIESFNYSGGPYYDTLVIQNGNFITNSRGAYQIQCEFDDKINPLNSLNIAPIFHIICLNGEPSDVYWSVWTVCNKNNMVKVNRFYNGLLTSQSNLSYLYNSDGFPISRLWYHSSQPGIVFDTMSYKYY